MNYMEGFLKGKPKALRNTSYEFLKQQDGYFIRNRIIKLNKHLNCSFTNKIHKKVVLGILLIDKASFGNLIELHDAQFEIIGGHYYNGGRNETINHAIGSLYTLKLKVKMMKTSTNGH